ncbi:MAG: CpaF family protein [Actinobacteria bacterium]|nr:CpaF family protein [Actinomycetota bacterium]
MTRRRAGATAEAAAVRARIADVLSEEVLARHELDGRGLSPGEERELARLAAVAEVATINQRRRRDGEANLDASTEAAIVDDAVAAVVGLGRLQPLLDDPDVGDVHVRGCEPVWVRLRDGRREEREPIVDSDAELIELVRRAATRLSASERRFDAGSPDVNVQLPDGSRMFAVMEVSRRPSLVVRRHRYELSSLDELVSLGMLDRRTSSLLASSVRARRNLVIAGGTGTGKTTLLRALINEVPRTERIVTIEDSYELAIDRFSDRHPDHDALQSRPPNIEGRGEVTLSDLARMALRMDPDRVIVGEVRGPEAFPMLMAMSQGNDGSMCTMHADSSKTALAKLAAYVSMADTGLPIETVNLMLAGAVHFVVHLGIRDGVRRVQSVREVVDAEGTMVATNEVVAADGSGYPLRHATRDLLLEHGLGREHLR